MSTINIIFVTFALVAFLTVGLYLAAPKNQDQVVFRTAIVLTAICCWTMYAITYIAQLHPLIVPEHGWDPYVKDAPAHENH
ncbi:H(+)-transporting V0 sector ATPase subunit e [Clydaea vesicula]|uniref:H(+)-transporting V0 sector ATPase subunit e n=1 Tax=Clydaea vesicula TaxID=447962 RepID=A0AAD5TTZ7_9FUNG|nr:H(+)-transporting V0 sector ATPase subunit e [Clydaea vesicula]KAJ3378046.1 H(+)-transporting V0 sector ATPase subunit e [Lobulomyces angularis]